MTIDKRLRSKKKVLIKSVLRASILLLLYNMIKLQHQLILLNFFNINGIFYLEFIQIKIKEE